MSIRFQADADLNFDIVKAVRRREPGIDFASAVDAELEGIDDAAILERAANEHRVLVSHDLRTMLHTFRNRLKAGKSNQGLLIVPQDAPIGPVVEAIHRSVVSLRPGRVVRSGLSPALPHSSRVSTLTAHTKNGGHQVARCEPCLGAQL